MLKILLILENDIYMNAGIERHCRNIYSSFQKDKSLYVDYVCKERIDYRYNVLLQKEIWNERQLSSIISQYDVIHVHGFASFYVAQSLRIATEMKKKVVYTPHYHPFSKLRRPLLGRLFFHAFLKKHLSSVNTIIAINNSDKIFFQRYNEHVIILPNCLTGIETGKRYPRKNVILAVGRNDSNKGLFHLNYIPFEKYEVHCVTNNGKGLDDKIVIHSNVTDAELNELYSMSALLVVPSKYEAFSYVALESLERGCPVLVSDGVRIVDHLDDISGFEIFEYNNRQDFISKLEYTISKTVDVQKIKKYFSPERIQGELKRIYTGNK